MTISDRPVDKLKSAIPRILSARHIWLVLLISLIARVCFLVIVPRDAVSFDATAWSDVGTLLVGGQNPYKVTNFLSWPPLWMQVIYVLAKVTLVTGIPFIRLLQALLIICEALVTILLMRLLRLVGRTNNLSLLLIGGISLNPIAILQVCQHCNFDVLVGLWVLLFVLCLVRYHQVRDATAWLWACLFLGLGVLTKTVPLILSPLLAHGCKHLPIKASSLGAILVLGPAALGTSVIYVLGPVSVWQTVISYQSVPGWFGLTGLLQWAEMKSLLDLYPSVFKVIVVIMVPSLMVLLWRRGQKLEGRDYVLLVALMLLIVPVMGPGYGPQYIYWFLPLLVATFPCYGRKWRLMLSITYVIAALTYIEEYALLPSHGAFLVKLMPSEPLLTRSREWSTQTSQTVLRLPLFLAYVVLLVTGVYLLRDRFRHVKESSGVNHDSHPSTEPVTGS